MHSSFVNTLVEEEATETLLVVDDVSLMHETFRSMLRDKYRMEQIIAAHNSDEALLECQRAQPDIVFLDINLNSELNGLQLIEKMLEIKPDLFIVIISADSTGNRVQVALDNGAKGFLKKPFSPSRVEQYIEAYRKSILDPS